MIRLPLLLLLAAVVGAGDAWVAIRGMSSERGGHSITLLPDGRLLVAGGGAGGSYNATCEIFDPVRGTWTPTGSMSQGRGAHVAVLLGNGKVLVAGGYYDTYLSSCELYDPVTGHWAAAASMPAASAGSATRLPDGRVLVVGSSAYVYNPSSNAWQTVPGMSTARGGHTATVLPDGRVLVAGGYDGSAQSVKCDLFNPATNLWSVTGNLLSARDMHAATLLPNGKVLVSGGFNRSNLTSYATCEEYDPSSGTWTATGNLASGRRTHGTALLPDGRLLAIGGYSQYDCESYDPQTRIWSTAATLPTGAGAPATLLPTGQVLATGSTCALYQPSSPSWTPSGALSAQRSSHASLLLANGRVLATSDTSAELYEPTTGTWTATGAPPAASTNCPLVLLPNGRALLVGTQFLPRTACSLFDPDTGTWSTTGAMPVGLIEHRAVTLLSGRVLVAGGVSTGQCAVYDPTSGTWSPTGSLSTPRSGHTATLLADGRVLVVGGQLEGSALTNVQASCEIYDPQSGAWSYTGSLITYRRHHTATLLPSGRVLVTGGWATSGVWSSCEVYDPAAGEWTTVAPLATGRYGHRATLATNGTVVVSGGRTTTPFSQELASCEVYLPLSGTWIAGPTLAEKRTGHTSTLLASGSILVSGGLNNLHSGWPTTTSEVLPMSAQVARQPSVAGAAVSGATVSVTGSGFSIAAGADDPARSSASSDNGRNSASNVPVASWRRSDNDRVWWLSASGGFTADHTDCVLPSDAAGPGWLRVHVNGTASAARFLYLDPPAVTLATSAPIISENSGVTTITATSSRTFALPVVLTIAVTGGTATSGDYTLAATTLTIPAGSLSASTTLTGVPDAIVEPGGETAVVEVTAVVNGSESGTQSATITITDYQSPGFSVSAISRHTTEAGQTATFTVQPSSPPLASVTLNLASTDSTEGVVSGGASLVFTTGNWTTPQTVTVTGVDDAVDDGNIAYSILGSASSSDPDYNNRAMPAVAVVNDDDDTAGITIAAPVGFITEGGGSATVGVSLASQPTSNVTVAIASGATNQGTAAPASLSFTTANWNIPQTVTVTGGDGDNADNPTAGTNFNLSATVTAGPGEYPTSITASRTLTCYPSNAAPTISAVAAQSVAEDSTVNAVPLAGIGAGGGTESQTLTITATSSDPAILPDPVVAYTSPGATGSLNLAPVANATGSVTVTVRITDDATIGRAGAKDAARSTEISFTVTVNPINDAPVVSGTTATPWSQAEDDTAASGTLIGAILGGLTISDADAGALRGLAVTAAETTNGTWQYNTGAGWNALGAVAPSSARLLADDGITRLRFVPMANYTGAAVLTFRAWDRSSGTNGSLGDASATGGTTSFSSTTAAATVTVTPVNDAPVLAGTTGNPLTTVVGGQANPGTPVAALIATLVSDLDGDAQGIAVVGVSGAGGGGTWQYSTDSGTTWGSLAGVGPSSARLLSDAGSMMVRYAPQANEAGSANLVFRAWDRSHGSAGGTADIATLGTGGTTAFSTVAASSTVSVNSGNAAPIIALPTALLPYTENQAATPLDPAATLQDADSNDFAGGTMTLAIILNASDDDRLSVQALDGVTATAGTVAVDGTPVAIASGGSGTTALTLAWNAAATPTLAQRVLRAICFSNTSDDPTTAVRIVRATTSDGDGATSFATTVTVTVTAVNDAPALAVAGSAGTWTEDQPALLLDAAASLSDPDSPAFASGTFSATMYTAGESSDVLAIRSQGTGPGQIAVANGEVSYGGIVFGTASGGSGPGTPLVVLLDADASQAAVQALLRNLTWVSTSQHPSDATRTVRLRLTDGAGGVSPDADIQVAVLPVNDAPGATVTAWQVNPGVLNYIPSAHLTMDDADAPATETLVATVTALPAAGSLAVNGVTVGVGGQFTWQQVLDTLVRYQAPASAGSYSLSFTVGDGTVADVGPFTLPITVTDGISNLPPVLELGGTALWQESLPPVPVDPNAEVSDTDSPVLAGGLLTAAVTLNGTGAERLSISDSGGVTVSAGVVAVNGVVIGTVTGGSGASPLNVALNAAATPERVTRVARAISFAVDAAAPGTADRRVTVQVSDGTSASEAKNALVQVIEVNSPPVVALPRIATATIEGAGATILDPGATCSDADSVNFAGGSVVVSLVSGSDGSDRLGLSRVGDITIVDDKIHHAGAEIGTWSGGGSSPITVLLNSQATDGKVADLLRCVTLENISEDPVAGTRVVRCSVSDGEGGTGSSEIGVYVAGINDAPAVEISGGTVLWRQGDPPTRIDDAATVSDVDSADFAGGRLTASLSSGASASDRLTITDHGTITVVAGSIAWSGTAIGTVTGGDTGTTPLVVSLTASASEEQVQDLLRALAFSSTAAVPSEQDRTVAVSIEDGDGGTSTLRSRVVRVQQVNLPPVVTLSGGMAAYTEDASAIALDAAATISDPEADLAGGVLTIIPEGSDDRLSIADQGVAAGQIGVTGSQVTWGGTPLGTLSGGNGAALAINLAQTATPAGVQDLLRAVRYASVAQDPPVSRSIGVTLNDGDGGTSALASRTVAITPVNDAPEATPTVLAVLGQTAGGTWSATDAEGDTLTWTLAAQPANGTLTITDPALGTWTFVPSDGGSSTATMHLSDGQATTELSVPVTVTRPSDPRPVVISDPPLSVQIGQTWTWELRLAATDLPAQPDLEIEAIGAPVGLTITDIEFHAATLSWSVPNGSTAGSHAWFTVRISDRISGRSCLQPVLIHLRAPIAGGG